MKLTEREKKIIKISELVAEKYKKDPHYRIYSCVAVVINEPEELLCKNKIPNCEICTENEYIKALESGV